MILYCDCDHDYDFIAILDTGGKCGSHRHNCICDAIAVKVHGEMKREQNTERKKKSNKKTKLKKG